MLKWKFAVGDSRRCVYANSLHMHTLINGISVVLKLAEFGSAFKLPPCDALDTKKAARIKRRYPACCPECKCGAGEPPSPRPLPSKTSIKSESLIGPSKESFVSIQKPKRHALKKEKKPCKPRKSFCVFKRNKSEHGPKKRKIDKPKKKPKVKKIEADCTYSTGSITRTDTTPREDQCPPEEPEKPPSQRLSREDFPCPPEEPEKLPSKRERPQKSDKNTFCKNTKNKEEVILKKTKKTKRCRPVFVDVATSTCTENTKHQYNVLQNKESGFEMYNQFDPTISGDTQKSPHSIQSSFEETTRENSDEFKYRFITCHLKEGTTPESLITTTSKSTTVMRDCLEATLSIYSPSICSMLPQRFEESHEILSTIVDHASNIKDDKGTETSTWPGIVFSTSASAQTCLIDYELFKRSGCNPKAFRKDYVIEETLTNDNLFQKTDSSSI